MLKTTGMAPAIYGKGTLYVTHMMLTPEILEKLLIGLFLFVGQPYTLVSLGM